MEAINITAYTNDTTQIDAIKAFLKALKIKFEVAEEKPYDPEFVSKIEESRAQYKKGNYAFVKTEELWKQLSHKKQWKILAFGLTLAIKG